MSSRRLSELETENEKLRYKIEILRRENAALKEANGKPVEAVDSELQRRLDETIQQLSYTRIQLMGVRSRLVVNEQVTEATQRRMLIEATAENDYEPPLYAELHQTTHTGFVRR